MISGSAGRTVNRIACPRGVLALFIVWLPGPSVAGGSGAGVPDTPFVQECHEAHVLGQSSGCNDVRAIAVDGADAVWAGAGGGVYRLEAGQRRWTQLMDDTEAGPVFDIAVDRVGTVWVGAWNGLLRSTPNGLRRLSEINHPVAAVCATEDGIAALGAGGIWHITSGGCTYEEVACSKQFRAALPDGSGGLWIATGRGLYLHTSAEGRLYQSESELLSPDLRGIAYDPDGSIWMAGLGGITIYKGANRVGTFTVKEGLPSAVVQCVACGPDGVMWVGTDMGAARYDGRRWSLRHSKRWLANDDVRDIAFDSHGTAWMATGDGVSAIRRTSITLAEKASHFLDVCLARHVREPGLVEKCSLAVPGDPNTWKPRDDDNDGQYTAMYLAMESFRYAVTKAPEAKANAKRAFEALRYLQVVTETPGFVARTVIPSSWTSMADPNRELSDRQWARMYVRDPRDKRVETRWHRSRDGKWLWKGDTSSDEITGHMFGYLFYYDLVADEAERRRACEHVLRIIDYIIENGYVLKDLDGTHTRWGVWAPEKLNDDPDWAAERGINSVEILSFLKLAHHVSGDEKYQDRYLRLLHEHDYAANVRHAKMYNPAWRTHIDDELLALAYPCLMMHENDPALQRLYRESLDHWYAGVKADCSPFFDFIYGMCVGEAPQLEVSVASLRDASLDLVRWTIDNSRREDIQLVRVPELELLQTNRLLPPSERGVIRWDENPWKAVQGDDGRTESDGVWWLLPYWIGRYCGYIQPRQ